MMKITTEEFASNFHSLDGITVSEKRKNLFLLLNRTTQGDISELDFSCIQPKNHLEERFKVDTLIYFRRISDLIELLKCENPILIDRILKTSWFFEEAFQSITGEQLVTNLFPYVSFRTKEKITHKLSLHLKDSQRVDEFYQAILKKYGLYLASKLVASCSFSVIMNHIKFNKRWVFTPKQLQMIIKRYPEAMQDIFKALSNNNRSNMKDYKGVFVSIAKCNIFLSLKYRKEYNLSYRFGWRITDRFIKSNKHKVIENPNMYYDFLHNKQIAKSLSQDFKDAYLNLFPKKVEDFQNSYEHIFSIFKQLPAKMRNLQLFLSSFEKVYGNQLWNHPSFITGELLEMLTPEERETIMKMGHSPSMKMSENEWCSYLKTEKSLPILKKRCYLTSNSRSKKEITSLLVKTCKINSDREALADICRYIIKSHAEDSILYLESFLNDLIRDFKLATLDEQHWIAINEILQIRIPKRKEIPGNFFSIFYNNVTNSFQEAYIHHRLINCLPIKDNLTEWLKSDKYFNIIKENPQYEKQCLLTFGEMVPYTFKGKNSEASSKVDFLCAVIDWNKRHPNDEISLFNYSHILKSVEQYISKEDNIKIVPVIMYFLHLKTRSKEREHYLKLYLLNPRIDLKIINGLIQHEPYIVSQHIESITHSLLNQNIIYADNRSFFWRRCNAYSHLGIPSKIHNICINVLQEETDKLSLKTQNAIAALSYLMPADEFLKALVLYYPSDSQADLKSKEGQKIYQFHKKICNCLKNTIPPSQALDTILIFCKGDYLKLILRSLYSLSNNTNEVKLAPFFNQLAVRAVSVRKHAIHLTFRVLDREQIGKVLEHFMKTDVNASVRKFIFKCAFNFFTNNPDDYFWELVKLNINSVDETDKEALEILMQIDKIPSRYFAKYIVFMWDFLKKESDQMQLLNSVTSESIKLLPKAFCEMVIKNLFFKGDDILSYYQSTVQSFTCKYIIYCETQLEQDERLNSACTVVKDYIISKWSNPELGQNARNYATNFLKEFCLEFLDKECSDKIILTKFMNFWNNLLKPHEAFDEYLHLQFSLLYMEKLSLLQLGQKLAELCDSLAKVYGPVIIGMFSTKLNFFSKYFFQKMDESEEKNRYILIQNLIKPESSVTCLLLVTLLINNNVPVESEVKMVYNKIVEMLQNKPEPVIQLYLQSHINGVEDLCFKYC